MIDKVRNVSKKRGPVQVHTRGFVYGWELLAASWGERTSMTWQLVHIGRYLGMSHQRAHRRAKAFCAKWGRLYPSATACVSDDLDALVVHLRVPAEHWKRIPHSNLIECTFGETRRRVKVVGRLPAEQICLSLVSAVLDRASKGGAGSP